MVVLFIAEVPMAVATDYADVVVIFLAREVVKLQAKWVRLTASEASRVSCVQATVLLFQPVSAIREVALTFV